MSLETPSQFVKALYFGGSSWEISWLNYVLGPMKCSGKQQLYPPEVDRLNKQIREQRITDNGKGLETLNEDLNSMANEMNSFRNNFTNEIYNLRDQLVANISSELQDLSSDISVWP